MKAYFPTQYYHRCYVQCLIYFLLSIFCSFPCEQQKKISSRRIAIFPLREENISHAYKHKTGFSFLQTTTFHPILLSDNKNIVSHLSRLWTLSWIWKVEVNKCLQAFCFFLLSIHICCKMLCISHTFYHFFLHILLLLRCYCCFTLLFINGDVPGKCQDCII